MEDEYIKKLNGIVKRQSGYVYNLTTVKKYTDNLYKIATMKIPIKLEGYEKKYSPKKSVNKVKLENNLIRAKTKLKEYVLCNNFEDFITLTLDKEKINDRYNIDMYIKELGQWIRNYNKKYKIKIEYILVPEQHLDGAWHMHGFIMGVPKERQMLIDLIPNTPKKLHNKGYMVWLDYWNKYGFCTLSKIKDKDKAANYILKYIKKDNGKGIKLNKKSYYASRGLKKSELIKKGTLESPQEYEYENEYTKIAMVNNINKLIITDL